MLEETSGEAKWYVVHTYSGYEKKVASNLEKTVENRQLGDLIKEVRVPTETVVEVKDSKKKEVERKIYPGYVLVNMVLTDKSWYVVRNIRGCTGFVGSATNPVPLSKEEVAKLGIGGNKSIEVKYNVGDSVRVLNGPFADFVGAVERIDKENNIVCITVSMFGRETPVELELSQVEPIM